MGYCKQRVSRQGHARYTVFYWDLLAEPAPRAPLAANATLAGPGAMLRPRPPKATSWTWSADASVSPATSPKPGCPTPSPRSTHGHKANPAAATELNPVDTIAQISALPATEKAAQGTRNPRNKGADPTVTPRSTPRPNKKSLSATTPTGLLTCRNTWCAILRLPMTSTVSKKGSEFPLAKGFRVPPQVSGPCFLLVPTGCDGMRRVTARSRG